MIRVDNVSVALAPAAHVADPVQTWVNLVQHFTIIQHLNVGCVTLGG